LADFYDLTQFCDNLVVATSFGPRCMYIYALLYVLNKEQSINQSCYRFRWRTGFADDVVPSK